MDVCMLKKLGQRNKLKHRYKKYRYRYFNVPTVNGRCENEAESLLP